MTGFFPPESSHETGLGSPPVMPVLHLREQKGASKCLASSVPALYAGTPGRGLAALGENRLPEGA